MERMRYWHDAEEIESSKSDYQIKTVEEYNALFDAIKTDKGWFKKFIALANHYYQRHWTGGNLHIVLDDENIENHHTTWCKGVCYGMQDHEGRDLAELMSAMTMKQRKRVVKNYDLYRA